MNYYINEIKEIFKTGSISSYENQPNIIRGFLHGDGKYYLIYEEKHADNFEDILHKIYDKEIEINKKITYDEFDGIILRNILYHKSNNLSFNDDNIKKIFSDIYSQNVYNYSVFSDIYGISLLDKNKIFNMSTFNIYYWNITKNNIKDRINKECEYLFNDMKNEYLIETNIEASSPNKAMEVANIQFEKWCYFMHVLIGYKHNKYFISNNNEKQVYNKLIFAITSGNLLTYNTDKNYTEPLIIDDISFTNNPRYIAIFNLFLNKNPCKFEKKIILAIEWLGQAYKDSSMQNSFLKAAISLEILFTHSEKEIITPSIIHQISESIALILGKDYEDCIKIEKDIKYLYGKRSSIVHSGSSKIKYYELNNLLNYSGKIIFEFLINYEYSNVKEIEELYSILKRKKYDKIIQ